MGEPALTVLSSKHVLVTRHAPPGRESPAHITSVAALMVWGRQTPAPLHAFSLSLARISNFLQTSYPQKEGVWGILRGGGGTCVVFVVWMVDSSMCRLLALALALSRPASASPPRPGA